MAADFLPPFQIRNFKDVIQLLITLFYDVQFIGLAPGADHPILVLVFRNNYWRMNNVTYSQDGTFGRYFTTFQRIFFLFQLIF